MTHIRTLLDQMAEIDEGRMKDIFTADQEGQSAKEIAKRLNIPLGTVKKILGEEEELKEFTNAQLDSLAKSYASMQGKTISIPNANKLRKIFDRIPDGRLNDLRKKKIPFLSGLALSRMIQKGIPVREELEEDSNKTYQVKDKTGKVVFTGKYNQVLSYRKKNGGEIVTEDKDGKAYAIGMAKAKEVMKDEPPLEKKTITKAHDIAKAVQRNESKQKPYVSSSGGQYNVLDSDGKTAYTTSNKQLAHAWFKKNYDKLKEVIRIRPKNALGEKKSAYRLSYEKDGKHAGFEDADTLSDLQNKAQKLRAKGFTIGKMGRNTSPVEQRLPEPEGKYEVGEETILEYTTKQIKQAYGILNDPRYKQGNYSGAYKAIEKIAKGLAKHKDVANALRRANEEYVHPGKATFERIWREVSDKLKLKVLDRKIKRTKDKFYKNLRRP